MKERRNYCYNKMEKGGLTIMKRFLQAMFVVMFLFMLIGCSDKNSEETEDQDEEEVNISGHWTGAIHLPGQPLHIALTIDGADEGDMSIPMQGIEGANSLPLDTLKIEEDKVTITVNLQGSILSLEGAVEEGEFKGDFTQNGQTFPFTLYEREETEGEFLSVETAIGTLNGELELPEGDGPFPVMIIIPGSGPTDRNGNTAMGDNDGLKQIAEQLATEGIASLRYDKRGAGKNKEAVGEEVDINFTQFTDDAQAWVELLTEDERFTSVGIIGHSQGSLEGMVTAQSNDVDVFISLAGIGRGMDEVLYEQLQAQLPEGLLEESEEILQQLKQGKAVAEISPELQAIFRPSVQPFLISMMQINPTEELEKLTIPVMLVNGERDIQVPATDAEILHEAKPDTELLILENMNHVLKDTTEDIQDNYLTYSNPTLPVADGLMDGMIQFLKKNNFIEE